MICGKYRTLLKVVEEANMKTWTGIRKMRDSYVRHDDYIKMRKE